MRRFLTAITGLVLTASLAGCFPQTTRPTPQPKPEPKCAVARIYPPINACPR